MAGLSSKDKLNLAILYEYTEFSSLRKWSEWKRAKCAEQILGVDMGSPGASERIAMIQGQAYAHEVMLLELKKIHKEAPTD